MQPQRAPGIVRTKPPRDLSSRPELLIPEGDEKRSGGTCCFVHGQAGGLARPKPPNLSLGCPVQASLGRGCSVVTETFAMGNYARPMPWGLKHFQQTGQLHFLTFSCYRRRPKLATPHSRACF